MNRPDPIEYAERLYGAIRAANFSPISFLAFGNAVKEGVPMRSLPRLAAEPFMRVVGEMLDLEEEATEDDIIDVNTIEGGSTPELVPVQVADTSAPDGRGPSDSKESSGAGVSPEPPTPLPAQVAEPRRNRNRR